MHCVAVKNTPHLQEDKQHANFKQTIKNIMFL